MINERLEEESWLIAELGSSKTMEPVAVVSRDQGLKGGVWIGSRPRSNSAEEPKKAAKETGLKKTTKEKETSTSKEPETAKDEESTLELPGAGPVADESGEETPETPKKTSAKKNSNDTVDEDEDSQEEVSAPIVPDEFRLSPDQTFKLRSAYRGLLRQRLIENRLDDRHDLSGNSLYVLKFDTTVFGIPAKRNQAKITIKILDPNFGVSGSDSVNKGSAPDPANQGKQATERTAGAAGEGSESARNLTITGSAAAAAASARDPKTNAFFAAVYQKWRQNLQSRINSSVRNQLAMADAASLSATDTKRLMEQMIEGKKSIADNQALCVANKTPERECLKNIIADKPNRHIAMEYIIRTSIARHIGVNGDDLVFQKTQPDGEWGQTKYRYGVARFSDQPPIVSISFSIDSAKKLPTVDVVPLNANFRFMGENCDDADDALFYTEVAGGSADRLVVTEFDGTPGAPDIEEFFRNFIIADLRNKIVKGERWQAYDHKEILRKLQQGGELENVELSTQAKEVTAIKDCEFSYVGQIEIGLLRFIEKISKYASYSYSVLPRESPVAVKNEIQRELSTGSRAHELAGTDKTGFYELQPLLSTFGDAEGLCGNGTDNKCVDEIAEKSSETGQRKVVNPIPRVGWVIAPSVAYPGLNDSLSSVSESILAIVSVPAWWQSLYLQIDSHWLDRWGNQISGTAKRDRYDVALPNNQNLLDALIFDQQDRGPLIRAVQKGTSCSPSVLIQGDRLWRNTDVTIGSTRASRISVLPDMSAVIAEFEEAKKTDLSGPLIVWTSVGSAEWPIEYNLQPPSTNCSSDGETP